MSKGNSFSVTGAVEVIGDVREISDKLRVRSVVVKTNDGKYDEFIELEARNEKVDEFKGVREGDTITAHFNLKGRKWTNKDGETKYFTTLSVWRVEKGASTPETVNQEDLTEVGDDDLPF